MTPGAGPTAGGSRITIKGANFAKVRTVWFGKVKGSRIRVADRRTLSVRVPAQTPRRVAVRVVTAAGSSRVVDASYYRYVARPIIGSVAPSSGTLRGGQTIKIQGRHFRGTTKVMIGGQRARQVRVLSNGTISAQVPPSVDGAVPVRVTTAGGTSRLTTTGRYTYRLPAYAASTSLTPSAGTFRTPVEDVAAIVAGTTSTTWLVTLVPGAPVPAVGDNYLVDPDRTAVSGGGATRDGLVGVVDTVSPETDGTTTVAVTRRAITDVLDNYTSRFVGAPGQVSPAPSGRTADVDAGAVTSDIQVGSIPASLLGCKGANGGAVSVTGSVSLALNRMTVDAYVNTGGFLVKPSVSFLVTARPTWSVNLTAAGRATCSVRALKAFERSIPLGPTGMFITVAPDITFEISGSARFTVSQTLRVVEGFSTSSEGKVQIVDSRVAEPVNVELAGSFTVRAGAGVKVSLTALRAIGVELNLGGGLRATLTSSTNPVQTCATFGPYVSASLSAFLDLWIAAWSTQLWSGSIDLPTATKCTLPPPPPPPNPPTSGKPPFVIFVRDGSTANYSTVRIQLPTSEAGRQVWVGIHRRVWWGCPTNRKALIYGGCSKAKDLAFVPSQDTLAGYRVDRDGRLSVPVRFDLCQRPSSSTYPRGIYLTEVSVKYAGGGKLFYAGAFAANTAGVGTLDVPFWNYTYGTLFPYPYGRTEC